MTKGELVAQQGGDDGPGEHGRPNPGREFPPETRIIHAGSKALTRGDVTGLNSPLEPQPQELASDFAVFHTHIHPGNAELRGLALGFDADLIALLPAIVRIEVAEALPFAAAERVGLIERSFIEVGV
ncbi:MAG: hypothetical protein ABI577_15600 [bacterium]